MPHNSVKILLVEDNSAEAILLGEILTEANTTRFAIEHVKRLEEALEKLAQECFDIVLLDLTLPDSQGLESLSTVISQYPSLPVVVLTNMNDDRLAVEAVRLGAQDYLVKRLVNAELLVRSVRYAIERKQVSEALRKANAELAQANDRLKQEIFERQRAQEELQRSNAELEEFAYVASHDLQQPLSTISSWAQMLAMRYRSQLDEAADKYIGHILDGTVRMQQLIEDLLAYSRVGRATQEWEPTNCEVLLKAVLGRMEHAIAQSHVTITYDSLPTVMADPVNLGQVFQNLLDNAIKYRGEDPPRIHISAVCSSREYIYPENRRPDNASASSTPPSLSQNSSPREWVFSITDNGIGIKSDYFQRIFVVFQRLHRHSEYPGTGIGLAICQKIVEGHGGRIWVKSELGKGSTFFFSIPDRPVSPSIGN
ncbi:MAG: hypothetical protein Fur0025_34140 [Oscillatoriaceae cyanobacterium]